MCVKGIVHPKIENMCFFSSHVVLCINSDCFNVNCRELEISAVLNTSLTHQANGQPVFPLLLAQVNTCWLQIQHVKFVSEQQLSSMHENRNRIEEGELTARAKRA